MNFPPPKSQGRTVMTSDFATILDGFLQYNNKAWEKIKDTPEVKAEIAAVGERRARRAGSVLDVSSQGYYNVSLCVPDFLKVILSELAFLHSWHCKPKPKRKWNRLCIVYRLQISGIVLIHKLYQAAKVIAANHEGKYKPVFLLDHSPIHSAKAPDSLDVDKMNVHPGRKALLSFTFH